MSPEEWEYTLSKCTHDALSKVFPHGSKCGMPAVDVVVQDSKHECQRRMALADRALLLAEHNPERAEVRVEPRGGKLLNSIKKPSSTKNARHE